MEIRIVRQKHRGPNFHRNGLSPAISPLDFFLNMTHVPMVSTHQIASLFLTVASERPNVNSAFEDYGKQDSQDTIVKLSLVRLSGTTSREPRSRYGSLTIVSGCGIVSAQ